MRKISYAHQKKKKNFQKNIISRNYWKNKEFLILVSKYIFLYLRGKLKRFHDRCVLNVAMPFFTLVKLNSFK